MTFKQIALSISVLSLVLELIGGIIIGLCSSWWIVLGLFIFVTGNNIFQNREQMLKRIVDDYWKKVGIK